jgi:ketosteroid isomerase-like protein
MSMRRSLILLSILAAAACSPQTEKPSSADDGQREIRSLLGGWSKAFRNKDVDGVMAIYAPGQELVAYDIVPPLEYRGVDAYRRDYAAFFEEFNGPLDVEIRDLHIVGSSDVAFSYGLERMAGTLRDGAPFETWVRFTQGYRRIGGHWYAVHDHISVPAEPQTGKARFDLKP